MLARVLMFIRFACFWPKAYHRVSLGKSHQNGDYLKQAMQKCSFPTKFEPAAFGLPVHCSIPLELEKRSPLMLNFGCSISATFLFYDFNNKSIMMFLTFAKTCQVPKKSILCKKCSKYEKLFRIACFKQSPFWWLFPRLPCW